MCSSSENDAGCILNQMQCFVYVCDADLSMLLTVKGGVHPFPIVPPPLNEGGGF